MIKTIVALLAVLALSTNAFAGFDGPRGMPKEVTVDSISDMKDETIVIIKGYLVKQINRGHYLFKDDTGNVEVDIKGQVFRGANVTPETQIRLRGEVEKDLFKAATVDVDYLEIAE